MANPEHVAILKQGVEIWNRWRGENPGVLPCLDGADLRGIDFSIPDPIVRNYPHMGKFMRNMYRNRYALHSDLGVDLHGVSLNGARLNRANLNKANLIGAKLQQAKLTGTNLRDASLMEANLSQATLEDANLRNAMFHHAVLVGANLRYANLREAIFSLADLTQADLSGASLIRTNLSQATLSHANLRDAHLVKTNFTDANLTLCDIYGISAWDLQLEGANQSELIITPPLAPIITVDNLQVAQFIYLLLNNEEIRHVIDTITSKVVLILGRFTPERKTILDVIKDELRHHDFLPVLFDFLRPQSRSHRETVLTLAHMARFVVADMTDARIVLDEVPHIVEKIAVPVVPLLLQGEDEPVTLYDLRINHRSLLPTCRYANQDHLLASLEEKVIAPAQAKVKELMEMR